MKEGAEFGLEVPIKKNLKNDPNRSSGNVIVFKTERPKSLKSNWGHMRSADWSISIYCCFSKLVYCSS